MGKEVAVFSLPSMPRNVSYLGVDVLNVFGQRPHTLLLFLTVPLSKSPPCDSHQCISPRLRIHPSVPALQPRQ